MSETPEIVPGLPNIVKDRMRSSTIVVNHPDPDVLTAFSERSLPDLERDIVLEHLARCEDCRDLLALSLPAAETTEPVVVRSVSGGWLAWPALRWGLVTAGIVLVASFGFLLYNKSLRPEAGQLSGPKTSTFEANNSVAPPYAAAALPAPHETQNSPVTRSKIKQAEPIIAARRQRFAGGASASPLHETGQSVQAASQAPVTALQARAVAPPPMDDSQNEFRVDRAKPADEAVLGIASSHSDGNMIGGSMSGPSIRWTINPVGGLQRSFDHGLTWQNVNIGVGAPETSENRLETPAKKLDGTNDSSISVKASASPVFRSVAANGADVWAGGNGAALFHSADAGDHWERILPSASGVSLTGDVVSVDFPDVQHGHIATATGEIWATADAGQTWQKQ